MSCCYYYYCYYHYFMIMKDSGVWVVLYLVVRTVLMMLLNFSSHATTSSIADVAFSPCSSCMAMFATSRKLKENCYDPSTIKNSDVPNLNMEDYRSIDTSPCSKASIESGPIGHSIPLNPYIPKNGFPSPVPRH